MTQIIDGKALAAAQRTALAARLKRERLNPHLAIILVGDHAPSRLYVQNKRKAAAETGIETSLYEEPATISQVALLARISQLNIDPAVHGILIQMPLPAHIKRQAVLEVLSPDKDVDGLTPLSQGLLMTGQPNFIPCTPLGCLRLIQSVERKLAGLEVVVIGRSPLVGNPLAQLLQQQDATVTVAHRHTVDLATLTRRADIVVAAAGQENILTADMVKPGAIVIDVGINRRTEGSLAGDVDFAGVSAVARAITPVPGGVGPMTVACLLENTVNAAAAIRQEEKYAEKAAEKAAQKKAKTAS